MKLTNELTELKCQLGVFKEVDCTDSETEEYRKLLAQGLSLPAGVLRRNSGESDEYAMFYTIRETKLTKDERSEYIQYKQLSTLITIKKCVVFFTVLAVISLVLSAIAGLAIGLSL